MDNSVSGGARWSTWHLCWQAAAGRDFVANPRLVERVRERLLDAHRAEGRRLLHYLMTPGEIHLLSRLSSGESPEAVVRAIASVVSRWVREIQQTRGPVFAAPYRAHEVRTDEELKQELRMLVWRPVETGLCVTPTHYVNSSLRTILGIRRAQGFDSRGLLDVFGVTVLEARKSLRGWIRRRPSKAELREWELNHGLVLAVGSMGAAFGLAREVQGAAATLVAAAATRDIDGALKLLERWVAFRLGLRSDQGLSALPGAEGARARALVAGLAVRMDLCPAAAVARHFHRAKATLSEQMATSRSREDDRRMIATPVRLILDEVASMDERSEAGR